MKTGWILRNGHGLLSKSIDENGIVVDGHSMIYMEEASALSEAKHRAKKYLARQNFFLQSPNKKRAIHFTIDM